MPLKTLPLLSMDGLVGMQKPGVASAAPARSNPLPVLPTALPLSTLQNDSEFKPGHSVPPPPPPARTQWPTEGPLDKQYPELRVVNGIANTEPLSLLIARSCKLYGSYTFIGGVHTLRTLKHVFTLTDTQAAMNGKPVFWWQRVYDAVRLIRGEKLPIGLGALTLFDAQFRDTAQGYFKPEDMPAKPRPMHIDD